MTAIEDERRRHWMEYEPRTWTDILGEDVVKPIIIVFCDYCQCRQPFDLICGGQMICIKCRHNVNTPMRKPEIRADISGFVD